MPVGSGETPIVARRRVRLALRKARQVSGLNQSEVADRLGWSLSKVQRIESGEVSVSSTDFRALIELHTSVDERARLSPDDMTALQADVRVARRQRWWTAPEYREHLTSATMELMSFESEAAEIRAYQPVLVPGVLQTPETTDAVLRLWPDEYAQVMDPQRLKVRQEARDRRRQQVIESEDAPLYFLILDESVLHREVGGLRVATEQMAELERVAALPKVHVRVLPLADGALFGTLGPFALVDLDEDHEDAVLYREGFDNDNLHHDSKSIREVRRYFEYMWQVALDEEKSRRRISSIRLELESRLVNQGT